MDSDTDNFESADEEFVSDNEKTENIPQVEKLSLDNSTSNTSKDKILKNLDNENNKKARKERPQRTREPKTKLGVKLGNKISKPVEETKKDDSVDYLDDWGDDWTSKTPKNTESNLYSEKFTPDKNFWEKEEDYMELPPAENKNEINSWSSWGASLLSQAQLGVSTISQGITTVLETGIGVPDPEELARLDTKSEKSQEPSQIGFGLGNLVSGVSHITELGTKVLTGGLDTLEVIGKKTMEVLQDGDPGLKKKRALFENKIILSRVLREAKEKAEQHKPVKPIYETIFDDFQGLIHLEALEMLSKQCDIKLESLLESLSGNSLQDMQETMSQIKELCELPDEEDDSFDLQIQEKLDSAISDLNIQITYKHFLDCWKEIDLWLAENSQNPDEIHKKAIESLAQLTAIAVEQFHKAAELLLIKERRSTVDEADGLLQLTIILTGVIGQLAGKFSEKLNSLSSDNVNDLITNIFFEAANSSSYIQDAFNLMIPVLQVGAI